VRTTNKNASLAFIVPPKSGEAIARTRSVRPELMRHDCFNAQSKRVEDEEELSVPFSLDPGAGRTQAKSPDGHLLQSCFNGRHDVPCCGCIATLMSTGSVARAGDYCRYQANSYSIRDSIPASIAYAMPIFRQAK
jgi:hypothetical protein